MAISSAAPRRAWRIPRRPFASMSWGGAIAASAVTLIGALIAGVMHGGVAAMSALLGGGIVMALMISGMAVVSWLTSFRPRFRTIGAASGFFVIQVLLMLAVVVWLRSWPELDGSAWAMTAGAAVVAWQIGMTWGMSRSRVTFSSSGVAV